jgi:hypothetical protein
MNGEVCLTVLLDMSDAFGSISHDELLRKLRELNIDTDWFRSFLEDRKQYVEVRSADGKKRSKTATKNRGSPQGSRLSVLFFLIYVNEIPEILDWAKIIMFVDDQTLYMRCKVHELHTTIRRLEHDIGKIVNWGDPKGIKLNPNKTKFLISGHPKVLEKVPKCVLRVMNTDIHPSDEVKLLGTIIDKHLNWDNQLNNAVRKGYYMLRKAYPVKYLLSERNRKLLVNSYVMPNVMYNYPVWGARNKSSSTKLDKLLRDMARYVLNLRKFDPVANEMTLKLKWPLAENLGKISLGKIVVQALFKKGPEYFMPLGEELSKTVMRQTRKGSYLALTKRCRYPRYHEQSNYCKIARAWFALSVELREEIKENTTTLAHSRIDIKKEILAKQESEVTNYSEWSHSDLIDEIVDSVLADSLFIETS